MPPSGRNSFLVRAMVIDQATGRRDENSAPGRGLGMHRGAAVKVRRGELRVQRRANNIRAHESWSGDQLVPHYPSRSRRTEPWNET